MLPGREGKINRRTRSNNIERDAMGICQDRNPICPYFISDIAISSNTISPHKDGLNSPLTHEVCCHIVRDQRQRDPFLLQFPCCETRTLKHRARFIDKNMETLACFMRHIHRCQCSSPASCCQCPRITMSKESITV